MPATPTGIVLAPSHSRPIAEIVRDRLTGSNHGLEVRRLTVVDAGNLALAVIAEHSEGCPGTDAQCERLKRNGLRLIRMPIERVDLVAEALGGATVTRSEWHGQAYDWRPLRDQTIDGGGLAVAIDGRVRRFERGEFRLLMRGWTLPMEDGPRVHVELLPQHRVPRRTSLRFSLDQAPFEEGEAIVSLALDLELQVGYAYVLMSVLPTLHEPQFDRLAPRVMNLPLSMRLANAALSEGIETSSTPGGIGAEAPGHARAPSRGPTGDDMIGPDTGVPRTLGEVLLPTWTNPPTREIMVLVPRIPDELFPPIYESELSSIRKGAAP